MEVDNKQKVLLAIYAEYQKDIPEMDKNISAQTIGLERDVFLVAIDKLLNEGLICDAKPIRGGRGSVPLDVVISNVKMTAYGIQYVEQKLKMDITMPGEQKVKEVAKRAAEWGWDQFKDFSARVLAEIAGKAGGMQ